MVKFSVLMSVYIKEKPEYLCMALESVLDSTILPQKIVIVEDGPLTPELYKVLNKYNSLPRITRVKIEKNSGLTIALNKGMEYIDTPLIARMDTDDLCRRDRFELQIQEFKKNPNLVLVGSNIDEFTHNHSSILSVKQMPLDSESIKRFSKLRNPFNHPTVIFRKEAVVEVGGYIEMPFFEDYYLWLRLLKHFGAESTLNINENLVSMRTVDDLYLRRGGVSYVKKSYKFRKTIMKQRLVTYTLGFLALISTSLVSVLPNNVRKNIYRKHLRTINNDE